MNATEHIVEAYFRFCKKHFTLSDVKVINGNNRQMDLLTFDPKTKDYFHVEISVTHQEKWCPNIEELKVKFREKYFGSPKVRSGANTDSAKGKKYQAAIEKTYSDYGVEFDTVKRIWCCWVIKNAKDDIQTLVGDCFKQVSLEEGFPKLPPLGFLSFREEVIPQLRTEIGTSNYDDEILRTISLLSAFDEQSKKSLKS